MNSRNYRIFGLPESKIAEMLGHHLDSDQPSIATYAETFGVRICSASRSEAALSEEILDRFEKGVILPLFSDFVYSSDGAALEAVVVSMLQKKKGSLLPWRSHAPVGCCQSCLRMSLEAPNGL